MLNYQNLLTLILILFCLHASYTDIKERKIKNLCAYGSIYAGFLSQIVLVLSGGSAFSKSIGTVLGGFFIAFVLYWFGILAAGDAKLFWGASMLLPSGLLFERASGAQFVPIVLVINIFAPYFFMVTVYLLFKTTVKQKWSAFAKTLQLDNLPKRIFEMILNLLFFLGLGYLVYSSLDWLNIQLEPYLRLLLIIALFWTFNHFLIKYNLEKFRNYLICPLLLELMLVRMPFSLVVWYQTGLSLLKIYLVYIAIFFFLRFFIYNLDSIALDKEIDIFSLQEGMVPAEQIIKVEDGDGEIRYHKMEFALPNVLNEDIILSPLPGGVSKQKITELKQLAHEGKFQEFGNKIKIQQSLRFAPVICLGVILTVFCRGPFYVIFW